MKASIQAVSVLAVVVSLLPTGLAAQTSSWQGQHSSAWRDSANWQGGIPGPATATLVSNGSPSRFDLLVPAPSEGDTARVGDLTIQHLGRIRFAPAPDAGLLIVHGTVFSLNGGELLLGDGRIIFRNDVQMNRGGFFDAGAGTLEFHGDLTANSGADFAPGSGVVVFAGDSDQTISGDLQFTHLVVLTNGTLSLDGTIAITGSVSIAPGSTVFVDSGATFTYGGVVEGGGNIVDVNTPPVTGVNAEIGPDAPSSVGLAQNYPNPFNPTTNIQFTISRGERVTLTIMDLVGRTMATLIDEDRGAGSHTVVWDGSAAPSGTYFVRLLAGGRTYVRGMQLMR